MRRSREEWRELVVEFRGSGARAQDFARQRGLNVTRLWWWCSELRKEVPGKPVASVRFLPVRAAAVVPSPKPIEAQVGAVVLRFECGTDVEYLAALVSRLENAC